MGDQFQVNFTDIACNVTASPGKTIAQLLNPSTVRLRLKEIMVSFDGTSASATPVDLRIARQTSAGTPNGNSTPTPVSYDSGGPASLATAVVAGAAAWTTEPTLGDILWTCRQPPSFPIGWQWPLGQEPIIAASARIALVIFAAASVNVTGHLVFEH